MIQVQPGQASVEISASRDGDIDARTSNGSAILGRICKRGCAILPHAQNLIDARCSRERRSLKAENAREVSIGLCNYGNLRSLRPPSEFPPSAETPFEGRARVLY